MEHNTAQEYISQFLDNELSSELLQPLFQHLGECEECRKFFVQSKSVQDQVKKVDYVSVPDMIDKKFEVLGMGEKNQRLLSQKFVVSFPSAMLSGILMMMISILFAIFIGNIQAKQHFDEQKSEIEYFRSATLQMPYYN